MAKDMNKVMHVFNKEMVDMLEGKPIDKTVLIVKVELNNIHSIGYRLLIGACKENEEHMVTKKIVELGIDALMVEVKTAIYKKLMEEEGR